MKVLTDLIGSGRAFHELRVVIRFKYCSYKIAFLKSGIENRPDEVRLLTCLVWP